MIGAITTPLFRISNYLEAGLWITLGIGFAIAAIRGISPRRCAIAAITLILFGISDLVEVRTGAWYRPPWLLIWKVSCLLVLLWMLIGYLRNRKRA